MNIQSYSKKELALAYAPDLSIHGAVNRLMSWINFNKPLLQDLQQLGYDRYQKVFTVKQVEKIFEYLGEP